MDDYDGILVMVVMALEVTMDNVSYMATIRNKTLRKTCRECLDDNQQ